MGYRKVYRTVDEQTTKKMVKMLQRHGIMAYGKSEGAAQDDGKEGNGDCL